MSENQKKIWITGASSGIGKAVAEKFANEGWKVAVSARRKELLDELAQNKNITSFPLDVTNRDQVNDVFKSILNEFGDLDICLFSSGTYEPKDEQKDYNDDNKVNNVGNTHVYDPPIIITKTLKLISKPKIIKDMFYRLGIRTEFSHASKLEQKVAIPGISKFIQYIEDKKNCKVAGWKHR